MNKYEFHLLLAHLCLFAVAFTRGSPWGFVLTVPLLINAYYAGRAWRNARLRIERDREIAEHLGMTRREGRVRVPRS